MARDLKFGSVKKYLLILFLPSCKTVGMNRKLVKKRTSVCSKKQTMQALFFLPTKFKLKFDLLSKV